VVAQGVQEVCGQGDVQTDPREGGSARQVAQRGRGGVRGEFERGWRGHGEQVEQ